VPVTGAGRPMPGATLEGSSMSRKSSIVILPSLSISAAYIYIYYNINTVYNDFKKTTQKTNNSETNHTLPSSTHPVLLSLDPQNQRNGIYP